MRYSYVGRDKAYRREGITVPTKPVWVKGKGRPILHPYDEWLNGEKWILRRPYHFNVDRKVLANRIRNQAALRGLRITCHTRIDDEGTEEVYVHAYENVRPT